MGRKALQLVGAELKAQHANCRHASEIKIALTGAQGTGKSTIFQDLKKLGYCVFEDYGSPENNKSNNTRAIGYVTSRHWTPKCHKRVVYSTAPCALPRGHEGPCDSGETTAALKAIGDAAGVPPTPSTATPSWIRAAFGNAPVVPPPAVPMILQCPQCHARHIDRGEFATKPHHTHACQSCGFCWRPAVVDTVGVEFLPGFKDPTK